MKREVVTCDKCGRQIQEPTLVYPSRDVKLTVFGMLLDTPRYDLCRDCYQDFKRWISKKDEPEDLRRC
jgi:hypothetical protein